MRFNRNAWSGLFFVAVLVGVAACSKKSGVDSTDIPDLAQMTRVYITTQQTIVRTGPGPQFKPIARIGVDGKVDVVARDGDWLLIVSKKGNGNPHRFRSKDRIGSWLTLR